MNLDLDAQLQVSLRALQDVVAPALAGAEKHVIEQLQLAIMTVGFVKTRLPDMRGYARMELSVLVGLAEESAAVAGEAPTLAAAAEAGRALLQSAAADSDELVAASRRLRDEVTALGANCADAGLRAQLDQLVLRQGGPLVGQARQWASPFGFELNPEDLPAPAWTR
jgi:hypothetical protein